MGDKLSHRFLSEKEAAAYLGISLSKMQRLRRDGARPDYIHFGDITRYTAAALDSFLAAHTVRPTEHPSRTRNGGIYGA